MPDTAAPIRSDPSAGRVSHPVFVTRKFPPSIGGMQTLAETVWTNLSVCSPQARLISHGGSNKHLIWWLPWAQIKLLLRLLRKQVDLVLTGDALTFAAMEPLARTFRVPSATMVMGLDVTYRSRAYRAIVGPALRRASKVLAISEATRQKAIEAGVPADSAVTIRLAVTAPELDPARRAETRRAFRARHALAQDSVVMVTLGRLVRRKGVLWLVENVMSELAPNLHYFVAGDGPDRASVQDAVAARGLGARVHILGRVSDETKEELLQAADLFVQPNIPVPGDMEGFGLVTLEAALRGAVVVASNLEGVRDAVVDQITGFLLPAGDAEVWSHQLTQLGSDSRALADLGQAFAHAAAERFGEERFRSALTGALNIGD